MIMKDQNPKHWGSQMLRSAAGGAVENYKTASQYADNQTQDLQIWSNSEC